MNGLERSRTHLETLGLAQAAAILDGRVDTATSEKPSYADFLAYLLESEVRVRRDRYLITRTRLAHLPFHKTLEEFKFAFQPTIDERQVRSLGNLAFVAEAANVILLGPPGVGQTHLAVGLGLQAIQNGYGVYFVTAHELIEDLRKAYNEQRLDRRLRIYRAPKVLIIDEMGVYAMDQLGASLFFQLVAARYEKSSIILTSNKGFAEWGDILGDPVIATAVLDRLLHHSHILNIRGDSYRLREKRKAGLLPSPFAHEQAALHSRGG